MAVRAVPVWAASVQRTEGSQHQGRGSSKVIQGRTICAPYPSRALAPAVLKRRGIASNRGKFTLLFRTRVQGVCQSQRDEMPPAPRGAAHIPLVRPRRTHPGARASTAW